MLCARTQSEHRQNLGEGIDGEPQPEHRCGAAQPGSQFIQLNVWELEVAEIVLVQRLSMRASASKPGDDGGLTGAEDPFSCGSVQSFGQRREHHGDLAGRGFQTVQWRVAPGSERGAARLAAKRLDPLSLAMLAIPNEGVDVCLGDAVVRALLIGTGVAFSDHALGGSPPAFHL